MASRETRPALHCSFCNKSQQHVRKLIAGPGAYICNERVAICMGIIVEEAEVEGWSREGVTRCPVCRHSTAIADLIHVPDRGVVCRGCVKTIADIDRK